MLWFGIPVILSIFIGFFLFYRFPVLVSKNRIPAVIPKVSIIIPARNEENNLPALLSSLNKQTVLPHEIIVVDDNSDDGTALTAMENGAQVVTSGELPEGWLGKPWSCYQGAGRANGDVFIFLDADTFLEPDALENIIYAFNEGSGAVSIFPYHRIKKIHEAFSAFFNVIQLAGMYEISMHKNPEPAGMFGPCLIISRKDYFKIGGHKAVRNEVLEHFVMAGILKRNNIPLILFGGKGALNVRMYPAGWKSLISGWSKSFARGAEGTPRLNMTLSIMWISGQIVSSAFFLYSYFSGNLIYISFWSVMYMSCTIHFFILFRMVGNFPLWSAVLYPVNLLFFLAVFSLAAYKSSSKGQVEWKGRKIN